jgi:hypothetical protein
MAIIKSATMTQASGSVGGLTYAQSRGCMYMRGRGGMTNPNTQPQQLARAGLTAAVTAWNALTDLQREGWAAYAAATPAKNALGDTIYLSGQNMFARQWQLATYLTSADNGAGGSRAITPASDAPSVNNTGQPYQVLTGLDLTGGVYTLAGTVPTDPDATNRTPIWQIGPPQNAGKTFFKGPFTLAAFIDDSPQGADTPIEADTGTPGEWLAAFQPAVGQVVPCRVRVLYDDGRLSSPLQQFVTVTTV